MFEIESIITTDTPHPRILVLPICSVKLVDGIETPQPTMAEAEPSEHSSDPVPRTILPAGAVIDLAMNRIRS